MHGQNGETLLRVNLSADGMLHFDRAEIVAAIRDERDGIGAMLAKFFHSFSKRGIPAGGTDWLWVPSGTEPAVPSGSAAAGAFSWCPSPRTSIRPTPTRVREIAAVNCWPTP